MTDLDELKALWTVHDRKLEASLRLNRRLLAERRLDRARSALGGFVRLLVVELVGSAIALVLLGTFAAANPAPRFLAPALALALGALALVRADIHQLVLARTAADATLARDETVAAAQRRLETLAQLRARRVRWTLLLAPLAWPPLAIVGLRALAGIDAWIEPGVAWLVANLAFGLAVLAVAWRLSVRHGARPSRSPWITRLSDALSGRSLADARHALAAIDDLERE